MPGFRADRFASVYLFHPLQRLRDRGTRIPILMYHSISDADESSRHPYYRTRTSAKIFERQVRFLHRRGYRTISVTEAFEQVQTGESVNKLVAITFDDGYRDFYTQAFPILTRYGYSATMFLPTASIGDVSRQFNCVECLTWSEVRELRKSGVDFGSHTVTHPQLRGETTNRIRAEIGQSKNDIQDKLGETVECFAYPYAFPETDGTFIEILTSMPSPGMAAIR